ncbi:MAG: L-serine ammonia-lyase, iron-sulfur-dependent, subunit alpha [Floccifex sp.]
MYSITEIFKIGPGPSSSHTFGPMKACEYMNEHYEADFFEVTLYGSLALTGKGHLTDFIIEKTLKVPCQIHFDLKTSCKHPNTMKIVAYQQKEKLKEHMFVSIGGGQIEIDGKKNKEKKDVFPHSTMDEIQSFCRSHHFRLNEYVNYFEENDLKEKMEYIFQAMMDSVTSGLHTTGLLPGKLKLERVSHALYQSALSCDDLTDQNALLLASYAYAASEQNASGNQVVTAPTMGSCGVIPALLYHYYMDLKYPKDTLIEGLKVAGLIGLLIQENATISGAKAGCQAEIGAACAMGAAMIGYCQTQTNEQIECAAEMGLEHHLGLTCDPVGGYVMIPCIERNAVAAQRSIDCARLARYLRNVKRNRVSFDMVVQTMNLTGNKLPLELKESSLGGLAVVVK